MLYIAIIVILTIIDQITKYLILTVSNGEIGYSIPIIPNFFHITYVENHGMIFGLAQGKINIVTIFSICLIGYIIVTEFKNFKNYTKWTKIGIAVIAAGALGNMIDRLFRHFVIDMVDFRGLWPFIFNVADIYVHIGIYIIAIDYIMRTYRKNKQRKE